MALLGVYEGSFSEREKKEIREVKLKFKNQKRVGRSKRKEQRTGKIMQENVARWQV